jgi:hypothetical protein
MTVKIQIRRDTYQNWYNNNPVLLNGELAYDTTNNKVKVGNGMTHWINLTYLTSDANVRDGYTGSSGYWGSKGDVGPRGDSGFVGSKGNTGFVGSVGYFGSVGYWGSKGYTGSASTVIGYWGSVGYSGSGYTGSKGYTGSASTVIGYTGSLGYSNVPSSSKGVSGDIAGMVAADTNYLYVCTANWTNGSIDIWYRLTIPSITSW